MFGLSKTDLFLTNNYQFKQRPISCKYSHFLLQHKVVFVFLSSCIQSLYLIALESNVIGLLLGGDA